MIMLSKSTEYALRALIYIWLKNTEGIRPGYREVSLEIEAPEQYTAKILQQLVRFDIIDSAKGRGGGFYFKHDGENISMFEVIKLVEGQKFFGRCGLGMKKCSDENPCPLHDQFVKIRNAFLSLVEKETISSMASKVRSGEAVLGNLK
jgi:Rrf2 family protein